MPARDFGIWNGVKFLVNDDGKRFEGTWGECLDAIAQMPGAAGLSIKALPVNTVMVGGVSTDINVRPNAHEVRACKTCGMEDCLCDFGVSP